MRSYFVLVISLCGVMGCGDPSAKYLTTDKPGPAEAAAAAISQYDTDQDGEISRSEAESSALDPKAGWDADQDGSITEEELVARFERYEQLDPGMQIFSCKVTLNGQPLDGAEVVFEPEEFLGNSIEAASGTTDINGLANMEIPEIVKEDPVLSGIRTGLYKVKITHPEIDIAARYNEETTLTYELSPVENVVTPTFRVRKK